MQIHVVVLHAARERVRGVGLGHAPRGLGDVTARERLPAAPVVERQLLHVVTPLLRSSRGCRAIQRGLPMCQGIVSPNGVLVQREAMLDGVIGSMTGLTPSASATEFAIAAPRPGLPHSPRPRSLSGFVFART